MAVKFGMPSLGHTMESGTIVEWLQQEGDSLAKGDPLLMVETDKVTTEVEAPMDGTLHKIVVPAGQERPIGSLLAILLAPGESPDPAETARLLAPEGEPAAREKTPGAATRPSPRRKRPAKSGRLRISPVARKLAARHGVEPATVAGSGPGGRITKDDILRAAAAAASPPQPAQAPESTLGVARTIPLTGNRGRVAQRLSQSWREIPRVTEVMHVDMSRTVDFRETNLSRWESSYGIRISLNDLVTKAVTVTLQRHPLAQRHSGGQPGSSPRWDQHRPGRPPGPGIGGAGSERCRPKEPGATGPGRPVLGRQGSERNSGSGRRQRRDLHHHQPGRRPRRPVHPHHQSSPGGDSGNRPDPAQAVGRGRAGWRSFPRPTSVWSSIIGPSTDTRPASS